MNIFPDYSGDYRDEKGREALVRMEAFYSEGISVNQNYWQEASVDTRFESGDQTIWADLYGSYPAFKRRPLAFNHIRPNINVVSGYQRRNRKSTIVVPVENGDAATADQFTKIMMWLNQQEGILETISDTFHGSLITGMNLLQVWLDYRNDPVSGNIKVDRCDYNSFLIDPFFRKRDLSDCNGIWRRSFLTKNEAMSLLPMYKSEISSFQTVNVRDGKFQFMPENYDYGKKKFIIYDEFYYKSIRKQRMLIDTETGECTEWRSSDEDGLISFLNQYPQITVIEQDIPTVRMSIVAQGHVLYDDLNPLGIDSYPFVPVFSYYRPELPDFSLRIQGIVRGLRDAQFLYNHRKITEADILDSQVNSGWIAKENKVVNADDLFELNGQGRVIFVKEDAQPGDLTQIQAASIPPATMEFTKTFADEINQISGINEEMIGSAVDDKTGILSMLRQGAGLTTLQPLFDNLDFAQKTLGRLIIDIVQQNFTPGKVKRIIEEEPTAQFYNKNFGKYDAAVEEGLNTTTQRQMQFAQMLSLREAGVPIPDDVLLEASTLQNKKKLTESIAANSQKKAEIEQMQAQVAMQEQMAKIELAEARAVADRGLGLERTSRVEENKSLATERLASASKDRMAGILDLVKAMKELDDIDIAQLEKLLTLSDALRTKEKIDKESENKTSAGLGGAQAPSSL